MTRQLSSLAIALLLLLLAGCVAYETVPAPYLSPQQRFDQAWDAAMGAMTDQKLTIMSQDRGAGEIRGFAGTITVTAILKPRANGTVEVNFETVGSADIDPGMGGRVSQSFLRRMGH